MLDIKNNGVFMNLENYKISTLPYIENASNEIMEKYNINAQYETEPPSMTTAVFATKAHGRVSAYNLYCLAPTGNSLKAGSVNLYTHS